MGTGAGGEVVLYNGNGGDDGVVVALPASGWTALGTSAAPPRFRYRAASPADPIQRVEVQGDLIRLRGGGQAWAYKLDEPTQGRVALRLRLGTGFVWCAEVAAKESGRPPSTARNDRPGRFSGAVRGAAPAACAPAPPSAACPFAVSDVRMGAAGAAYFDGEILQNPPRMTFMDAVDGAVWVARLDPATGDFVTANGRDILVSSTSTSLTQSGNGPEWGVDAAGAAVYFTRPSTGVAQIWRAPLAEGSMAATPLTSGTLPRLSPLPRNEPGAASTPVVYLQGDYATGDVALQDSADPTRETVLDAVDKGVSGPRFIPGSPDVVFASTAGQLQRYIAATA